MKVSADDPAGKAGLSLHNYFIGRAVERLRPGGLAAFVVSRFLMDAATSDGREFIASMADLLAAVRLPEGAMRAAAGTDVVVDILFLRKRMEGEAGNGIAWIEATKHGLKDGTGELHGVNSYWADHPGMVLGKHAINPTSQYGKPVYTCKPGEVPLDIMLAGAIHTLPEKIYQPPADQRASSITAITIAPSVRVGTAADGARIKEGSYFVDGDVLYQIIDSTPQVVEVKNGAGTAGIFKFTRPNPQPDRNPRCAA